MTANPLPELARRLTAVALAAVHPERLVRDELARRGERFAAVVALGKAASAFARGVRQVPAALDPAARRLLLRPHSTLALLDPLWEEGSGGHPTADLGSLAAGERLERWLACLPEGRPLLVLVSGGASACVELPAPGLELEDLAATQQALLASGLPIPAVNAVRKHLSALAAAPCVPRPAGRRASLPCSSRTCRGTTRPPSAPARSPPTLRPTPRRSRRSPAWRCRRACAGTSRRASGARWPRR